LQDREICCKIIDDWCLVGMKIYGNNGDSILKKILITGSRGQLGIALNEFYGRRQDVQIINTDVKEMDITDEADVMEKVCSIRPDIIVNCAAHTQVDACESEEEKAYLINAKGPQVLSLAANAVDAVLVHISSDYVYDGKKETPYVEGDAFSPQSAYGRTKLAGEEFVRNIAKKYFIIRTAWLYGEGRNFVNTMLKLSETHDSVRVVCDQIGTPTSAVEVVKVIHLLCGTDKYGTYHATCEGSCSWAEFTETIFRLCGKNTEVIPVTTQEYGSPAKRPAYSILENKKLKEEFGYTMAEWHEALERYLADRGLMKKENGHSMKKKVLVTGANGYIGRHVVSALLDMGHEVIASDFSFDGVDERAVKSEVPLFSGDEDIYEQFGRPDSCIHLAWRNGFVHNADSHITDLPNHFNFIKNMIEGGLPQLAVMGTMHEIGYWEGAITEDTPANPVSLYGIAKNALRQMTFLLASGKDVKIDWLRAYYILGDDKKSKSIFAKIVGWEEEGKETFPFNSGKNKYDFITVDELAAQIATAATQDEIHGVINCCTGNPVSLGDKVDEFIKEHGFKIRPEYGAFPDRPYDSPGVWGDAEKIKKIMKNR
jgi:dTDP-4-dehydrorhamnose reductase